MLPRRPIQEYTDEQWDNFIIQLSKTYLSDYIPWWHLVESRPGTSNLTISNISTYNLFCVAASLCFQGFQSQLQVHQVWIQCIILYTWCSCMLLYFLVEARTHKVILVNKNQLGQVLISPCYFNNLKRAIILYMVVTKFNYLIRFHNNYYYRNFGLCSRWTSLHHLALSLQHLVRVWSSVDASKNGTTRLLHLSLTLLWLAQRDPVGLWCEVWGHSIVENRFGFTNYSSSFLVESGSIV